MIYDSHLFLVAYVPRWFPGTGWMDTADRMRASVDEVLTKPMNMVREQLVRALAVMDTFCILTVMRFSTD